MLSLEESFPMCLLISVEEEKMGIMPDKSRKFIEINGIIGSDVTIHCMEKVNTGNRFDSNCRLLWTLLQLFSRKLLEFAKIYLLTC